MNQKYFDICNKTIESLMDKDQGDLETANNTLSKLLVEVVDVKMFLMSTGRYHEYVSWIKRFKAKHPGIEKHIANNLELEEV
jgi:hypothetical protein